VLIALLRISESIGLGRSRSAHPGEEQDGVFREGVRSLESFQVGFKHLFGPERGELDLVHLVEEEVAVEDLLLDPHDDVSRLAWTVWPMS